MNDCSGLHYFKDPADSSEYCYTELEPFSCHKWFPCFDQPDIKACYELLVLCPDDWTVTSTCQSKHTSLPTDEQFAHSLAEFDLTA